MANIQEPVSPGFPPVYLIDIEDNVIGGEGGTANRQAKELVERSLYNKKAIEKEVADRNSSVQFVQDQVTANSGIIESHTKELSTMKGRGGYLTAYDFGKANPSQDDLNIYALAQIGSENPADIWNGTHVKNLFDSHVWVLTNTPDTDPPIHKWVDDGFDSISPADQGKLGVVMGSLDEGSVSVDPVTGKMSIVLPTGLAAANSLPFIARHSPYAISSGKREITIKGGTFLPLKVDGIERWYKAEEDVVLDVESILGNSLQNGKDYTIFLVPDGEGFDVKIDTANVPVGYEEGQVLAIGGFHTECADVGTGLSYIFGGLSYDHPLNGWLAGDILPQSVWCLNHRPHSSPKGMVYIPTLDFWCDIYMQSGSGPNTKSVFQGAITRSRQYVDHVEDMFCVNKELLDDAEFAAAMLGSNEQTAVAGASEAGATTGGAGGRKDTAGRRMVSIYGVEEGCGSLWQWLRSTSAGGRDGYASPVTSNSSNYGPFKQAGGKGSFWGLATSLLAGGDWSHSTGCGSRARHAYTSRSYSDSDRGGRGRSRTRR